MKTMLYLCLVLPLLFFHCSSNLQCKRLGICKEDGLCKNEYSRCVATDESCRESDACKKGGLCFESFGVCVEPCEVGKEICTGKYKMTCAPDQKKWLLEACPSNGCSC